MYGPLLVFLIPVAILALAWAVVHRTEGTGQDGGAGPDDSQLCWQHDSLESAPPLAHSALDAAGLRQRGHGKSLPPLLLEFSQDDTVVADRRPPQGHPYQPDKSGPEPFTYHQSPDTHQNSAGRLQPSRWPPFVAGQQALQFDRSAGGRQALPFAATNTPAVPAASALATEAVKEQSAGCQRAPVQRERRVSLLVKQDQPIVPRQAHRTRSSSATGMGSQDVAALRDFASSPHLSRRLPPSDWEIPFRELKLHQVIGSGSCGRVYAGTWRGIGCFPDCLSVFAQFGAMQVPLLQ